MNTTPLQSDPASHAKRRPLYQQMVDTLRGRIERGELLAGGSAPSESDLIAEFRVSSTTARRCLNDLAQSGLVYRVQGKGTFVSADVGLHATRQIGVLYHDLVNLTDTFTANALRGLNDGINGSDLQPALLPISGVARSHDPAGALRRLVHRHELSALLLISPMPPTWLAGVLDDGLPVTAVNFAYDDPRIDSIPGLPAPGVERLMRLFRTQGHRRITVLRGLFASHLVENVGMAPMILPELPGMDVTVKTFQYFEPDAVRTIVTQSLAERQPSTAFLCRSYESALEAAAVIREHGWSIPGDISLAFLGVPTGPSYFSGEVVPIAEMMRTAVSRLIDRLDGRGPLGPPPTFTTSFNPGMTLGPVRADAAD